MTTTIQINRKSLIAALNLARKVASKRSTAPIVSHVRLSIAGDVLNVDATDLDQDLTVPLAFKTHYDSALSFNIVCIDLSEILVVAKISKAPSAYIVSSDDGFTIDGVALKSLNPQDWPTLKMPSINGGTVAMTNEDWLSHLATVSPVASTEDTRYYLNGVLIRALSKRKVAIVATDGHRIVALEVDCTNTLNHDAIIPNAAVKTMVSLFKLGGKSDEIALEFLWGSAIRMKTEHFTYCSKTIDGTYPEYNRAIPKFTNAATQIYINTETLADAAKSIMALPNLSKLSALTAIDNEVTLATLRQEKIKMSFTLDGATVSGETQIGFNAAYLADLSKSFDKNATLRLQITDPSSPVLITSESANGILSVLMPCRL